ncbi:hypothetical protein [Lysobacter sp. Root690]|uniref:hypothetical protein n=1 Tax=Lysobacter sp. Root690 TaxID=1736588 RepID=UPI00070025DA|nr:hypothetical protein [Lysobacter sp. Root690]KRB06723.1 hypothetical protein ASD86_11945 [Lysobacter sp. Root690]
MTRGWGVGVSRALALFAGLSLSCGAAMACSTTYRQPAAVEVANTAAWILIAHVETVHPLTQEQDELALRIMTGNVPMNVSFALPTQLADATLTRALKGAGSGANAAAAPLVLHSGVSNCDFPLSAGADYLILANPPKTANDGIRPLAGSFKLDDTAASRAKLADLQTHLSTQTSSTP